MLLARYCNVYTTAKLVITEHLGKIKKRSFHVIDCIVCYQELYDGLCFVISVKSRLGICQHNIAATIFGNQSTLGNVVTPLNRAAGRGRKCRGSH